MPVKHPSVLPIRKPSWFPGIVAAMLVIVFGYLIAPLTDTTGSTIYLAVGIIFVLVVNHLETCLWSPYVPNECGSIWEINNEEGYCRVQAVDPNKTTLTSPQSKILVIEPRSIPQGEEPQVRYILAETGREIQHASQICRMHVLGLVEAAQHDLHGTKRSLLGPNGARGTVCYSINNHGDIQVETQEWVGWELRIKRHGELRQILSAAKAC